MPVFVELNCIGLFTQAVSAMMVNEATGFG
jgi:hypothetical protein